MVKTKSNPEAIGITRHLTTKHGAHALRGVSLVGITFVMLD
ncbi:MAG: hypothetical protein QM270_06090 [Bacillota bacterium]|nr:hypothetical protein [Bacillota bacterium]